MFVNMNNQSNEYNQFEQSQIFNMFCLSVDTEQCHSAKVPYTEAEKLQVDFMLVLNVCHL